MVTPIWCVVLAYHTLHCSWINNYLCNQCLSSLPLWVRIPLRRGVLDKTLCDKVCQWPATGRWFSQGPPVSSTNTTDRHDITKILLKVVLNTINQNRTQPNLFKFNMSLRCVCGGRGIIVPNYMAIFDNIIFLSEWVSDCCFMQNEQLSALSWREQVTVNEMVMMSTLLVCTGQHA